MTVHGDLLARLRARDSDTLGRVVQEHTGRLFRAARGMGLPPERAEDAVQEVFVTFFDSIDRYEGRGALSTWLFGILIRKVHEARRAKASDEKHDPLDETWAANFDAAGKWAHPPADPERALEGREFARAVASCLDDLTPEQREVLVLRQFRELPALTVGKVLDLTVTHVGVLLHRGRLRMRACLDRLGWRTSA